MGSQIRWFHFYSRLTPPLLLTCPLTESTTVHREDTYNEDCPEIDVERHTCLVKDFSPDLVVAMSSGATIVGALTDPALGPEAYTGPVWMISSVKVVVAFCSWDFVFLPSSHLPTPRW